MNYPILPPRDRRKRLHIDFGDAATRPDWPASPAGEDEESAQPHGQDPPASGIAEGSESGRHDDGQGSR